MRRITKLLPLCALVACTLSACTRRDLSDVACGSSNGESTDIEVSVNWSATGFNTLQRSKGSEDYIHRVSFRFFPKDGSQPFDRYLEDDVEQGEINVPAGEYSVVVFNESIHDPYWRDAIEFTNVDSYPLFAAEIVDQPSSLYDFYNPEPEEQLSVEALQLASAAIPDFVVTESMCTLPRSSWSDEEIATAQQLNPVTPRRLTCPTTINVDTENLASAYHVYASLTGLAQRVFMASGDTDTNSTTHVGELTQRIWHDDDKQHGVIKQSRLTFSAPSAGSTHTLTLEVLLVDGARYVPEEEMVYDVTDQILAPLTRYADNDLGATVSLSLPEVSGDVEVDEWGDDKEITIR